MCVAATCSSTEEHQAGLSTRVPLASSLAVCADQCVQVQQTVDALTHHLQGRSDAATAALQPPELDFLSQRLADDQASAHSVDVTQHFKLRTNAHDHSFILQGNRAGLATMVSAAAASESEYASLISGAL